MGWVVRPEIWHVYSKPQTFEARFEAKENWVGPYFIRGKYKNKEQVYKVESEDGILLTYATSNGRKASNFHIRYLRPYLCEQNRTKELPPLFEYEREEASEEEEEVSEKEKIRRRFRTENIGQLPRDEQNMQNGYVLESEVNDKESLPRDVGQIKLGIVRNRKNHSE